MKRIAINPGALAAPVGPFDRAVRIGPWLFISGTSALTHLPGDFFARPLPPTMEEQARLTFLNIKSATRSRTGGIFGRSMPSSGNFSRTAASSPAPIRAKCCGRKC
jgi:hypothetical protein